MIGKIYEQKGDKAQAIEHYEKFLQLLENADPGITEVEDVEERLLKLREDTLN
jgi:DNA-binding SARP family transcriptional activator